MSDKYVQKVPAGKRPKINRINKYNKGFMYEKILRPVINWFKAGKLRRFHFVVVVVTVIPVLLGLHDYLGNFVYVVRINDREAGIVSSTKEVEGFVLHLTEQYGNLSGMVVEPATDIELIKKFMPGAKPNPEKVRATIRQQIAFVTDAYMIKVDGDPFIAVRSEEDLGVIVRELKKNYSTNGYASRTIGSYIREDLTIEPSRVDPGSILETDEVVEMLTVANQQTEEGQSAVISSTVDRIMPANDYAPGSSDLPFSIANLPGEQQEPEYAALSDKSISVNTVDEVVVREVIPFAVEIIYDEALWVVQREITVPGEEGSKEVVYHVTRENGIEIDREKVSETIIAEPVTQVETVGTAKVSAVGTGRFIWPVEGGGEITPGRGFSAWHTGIDIHAATGTNILAADSGVVWFSGFGGSQGNYIILYHGSFWTLYLHNSENLVSEGDTVEQGAVIARAGSTGRSTGPHLHFEVRLDDGSGEWLAYYQHTPIDPLQFFKP